MLIMAGLGITSMYLLVDHVFPYRWHVFVVTVTSHSFSLAGHLNIVINAIYQMLIHYKETVIDIGGKGTMA